MGWQDKVERWELEIISRHNMMDIPVDAWTARKLAKMLYFMDLAKKHEREGNMEKAECRKARCELVCRLYYGRKCARQGGQKVPTVIGILKVPFGNSPDAITALFMAEAAAGRNTI